MATDGAVMALTGIDVPDRPSGLQALPGKAKLFSRELTVFSEFSSVILVSTEEDALHKCKSSLCIESLLYT